MSYADGPAAIFREWLTEATVLAQLGQLDGIRRTLDRKRRELDRTTRILDAKQRELDWIRRTLKAKRHELGALTPQRFHFLRSLARSLAAAIRRR